MNISISGLMVCPFRMDWVRSVIFGIANSLGSFAGLTVTNIGRSDIYGSLNV